MYGVMTDATRSTKGSGAISSAWERSYPLVGLAVKLAAVGLSIGFVEYWLSKLF